MEGEVLNLETKVSKLRKDLDIEQQFGAILSRLAYVVSVIKTAKITDDEWTLKVAEYNDLKHAPQPALDLRTLQRLIDDPNLLPVSSVLYSKFLGFIYGFDGHRLLPKVTGEFEAFAMQQLHS